MPSFWVINSLEHASIGAEYERDESTYHVLMLLDPLDGFQNEPKT